ncbi:hypothetical protein BGZ47_008076 [Haplosporangium gracile]|nr:hypothetical protein BGZ47_008076 [Haplosporangium gracile]
MVRNFHVAADKWIGYYAGLLSTDFWGANLATTGKYGRKTVMLFGLFMTSLSTVYLGLSTCCYDAIGSIVQNWLWPTATTTFTTTGTATSVTISKAGTWTGRENNEYPLEKVRVDDEHEVGDALANRDSIRCAESGCGQFRATTTNAQYDFASKEYSALVIVLALGAALGPFAGGVLTKEMIPGFEAYPYYASCLHASAVGLFVIGVMGLVLNETHPKWSKASELEKTLENLLHFENMGEEADEDVTRGRSGYESSRHHKETQAASATSKGLGLIPESTDQDVVASLSVGATVTTTTTTMSLGTRPRLQETAGAGTTTPATAVCTCHPHKSAADTVSSLAPAYYRFSTASSSNVHPRPLSSQSSSKLSPARQLYLTLAIYTLLVLTSILGSEFVMLYTQSPTFRGGLGFSANTLGQILTLRGILKLRLTSCGYSWMESRVAESRALSANVIGSAGNEDALTASDEGGAFSAGGGGGSEKSLMGMGVILLCLSLISMGDVLGYVSVLVLNIH